MSNETVFYYFSNSYEINNSVVDCFQVQSSRKNFMSFMIKGLNHGKKPSLFCAIDSTIDSFQIKIQLLHKHK